MPRLFTASLCTQVSRPLQVKRGNLLLMAWVNSFLEKLTGAKEQGEGLVNTVGDLLAKYGWTIIFLIVVYYNTKDPIRRRWRAWQNKRSIAHANRASRRTVLDRERQRVVTEKQREVEQAKGRPHSLQRRKI